MRTPTHWVRGNTTVRRATPPCARAATTAPAARQPANCTSGAPIAGMTKLQQRADTPYRQHHESRSTARRSRFASGPTSELWPKNQIVSGSKPRLATPCALTSSRHQRRRSPRPPRQNISHATPTNDSQNPALSTHSGSSASSDDDGERESLHRRTRAPQQVRRQQHADHDECAPRRQAETRRALRTPSRTRCWRRPRSAAPASAGSGAARASRASARAIRRSREQARCADRKSRSDAECRSRARPPTRVRPSRADRRTPARAADDRRAVPGPSVSRDSADDARAQAIRAKQRRAAAAVVGIFAHVAGRD